MKTVQNREAQIERVVLGYVAAWNENDPQCLRDRLAECWSEQGIIVSNYETVIGREALYEYISKFRQDNPGARGIIKSNIEQHHDFFRFSVAVVRPDGSEYSSALDVGELDTEGRIARIVTFFQETRRPPPHWPVHLTR